ncbi:MAG: hypothetical protein GY834_07095 [Bacteroidetes bacterium]|nr:hypothetical protein [Bacteroidota bacterium]
MYDKRWVAEEEVKKFMQRLIIEFFSSIKENGLMPDFYANIFMLNLVSFLAQPVVDKIYESIINQHGRETIPEIPLADSLLKNRLNRVVMQNINEVKIGYYRKSG